MAAYAALLSLMHTINDLQCHPQPPISLHPKHLISLTQTLAFLQDFLERYSTEEDEHLERRITAAAHAAEDVIETYIVNLIESGSTNHDISFVDFDGDLERAIQALDLIKGEAMEISETKNKGSQHHQLHANSSATPAAWQSSSSIVVIDYALVLEVLDKLVVQQSKLQIIPIVGMGGIGKTTFATNIYSQQLIVEHFDILAWVEISQECSGSKILSQVLGQQNKGNDDDELDKLGLRAYQRLFGMRYLIVMDDIWSSEPWDEVKRFFPDNNNGSRIVITTRKSNLAFELSGSQGFRMNFLNEDKSWDLLRQTVFGKESSCPLELEETGKEIARKCRGLPLSVVVIGGVLRRSNMTGEYWEYTLKNLNSLIHLEGDEYCLQLLHRSYQELSVHLKPCFLYMGIFPEDRLIRVSDVIKMWIAEGIVKPIDDGSLEEVAEEYLRELVHRNLIIVAESRWDGRVKTFKIHDVLRDVCIREAKKQGFYCVVSKGDEITEAINLERRICLLIRKKTSPKEFAALKSASLVARSLFIFRAWVSKGNIEVEKSVNSRVLRFGYGRWWGNGFLVKLKCDAVINSRCIYLYHDSGTSTTDFHLPHVWNLQALAIEPKDYSGSGRLSIWKMPQLRHAKLRKRFTLIDPVGQENFVLEHLHTLSGVVNFKCEDKVVKRIPNIKKLKLVYKYPGREGPAEINLCLLNNLHKLQTLSIDVSPSFFRIRPVNVSVTFPQFLKKLTLKGTRLNVEELNTSIASLPFLQFLRIGGDSFRGSTWKTGEAQFRTLTHLQIKYWRDLKYWITDDISFPFLQHLFLSGLKQLEEIPSSIGDIPTLRSIRVEGCSESAQESAQRIKEEQEDYCNEDLRIIVSRDGPNKTSNFDVLPICWLLFTGHDIF